MDVKTLKGAIKDIEAVVFDKDGTLVGGINLWKKIFSYQMKAAEELGLNIKEIASKIFGASDALAYSPLVTFHASEAPILMATAIWLVYKLPWFKCKEYGEKIIESGAKMISKEELYEPLPYAIPAIEFFSKIVPVCIATSDSRENTIEMIKYLNLKNKIKCIVTSDEVKNGKPDADILLRISELLATDTQKILSVGDNEIDVETAKRAGAKSIIVGEEDLGADGWVRDLGELITLNKGKKNNGQENYN